MVHKDKQHFVSQSYLRNFSPDLMTYLQKKDSLSYKKKKKMKLKMKIHYYDIEKYSLGFRNIYSLARIDHYLLPIVDEIVKKTENNLSLIREIINERSEEYLYQNRNQETLWEIVNCLNSKAFLFRDFAKFCNSLLVGEIVNGDKIKKGTITYTEKSAELFQTSLLTNDLDILYPLLLKSFKINMPSANVDETFHQLSKDNEFRKENLNGLKKEFRLPKRTLIPDTVYPILIENKTDLPFITGDEFTPKGGFRTPDLKNTIENYYFPISPDLAIRFLEKKELERYFPREINDKYEVHKMNCLIYNCSKCYLFSNQEKPLRLTTLEPKEILNRYKTVFKDCYKT